MDEDTDKGVSILGRGKSCLGLSRTEVQDLDEDAQPTGSSFHEGWQGRLGDRGHVCVVH